MLGQLRKCLDLLSPAMRRRWVALAPLVLVTAVFEAVGAAAVFGLIKILTDPGRLATMPVLAGWLPRAGTRTLVLGATAAVALFYVVKNVLAAATAYALGRSVEEATAATSTALLRGYLAAPYTFHLQRNSADLIYDAGQAVDRVFTGVMAPALVIVTEALVALGILTVLFVAAPGVTLVAGTMLIGFSWLLLHLTRAAAIRLGARLDTFGKTSLRRLQQALGGIKEIKVLGRERFFADAFARERSVLARVRWRHGTFATLPRLVVETVFVCGALLVVLLVTLQGGSAVESVPLLGLYAYAGFRVIPSANRIVWLLGQMRHASAALDRVHGDLTALGSRADEPAPRAGEPGGPLRDRLSLEQVSYAYDGSDRPILADLTLTIRRGESVGIVGATGVGKSTLVDLVVGLLQPSAGRIAVDGVDLHACRTGWQRQIGYVPQTIFLLDDTLRRNIALGVPDAEIDAVRLAAAARRAQLDALVASLPAGLDTTVGERGVRLSGGERQRVGIARALYHEPAVLVFDEATSALDAGTEADLARAIEALRGETTLILIAHRLASVRRCDRLVLLRDGRIADSGSFDELVARNADFRRLAAASA